ncbi:UNVERIFIED_CONTAM: Transposon Ty2-B Gag-Pol polyprotein [Sesamum radiatum]|uniref:Transposon Ty2-B Gag-Pol polyprotein n=1 Tax=Sesamum radiatum TaxID=300843 RepID=A0AAW2Q1B8_SESRA
MTEGSSVHSHGVKMLSLVEKLEDLKVRLNNNTYIDVILQSLLPSYDLFIVNYNMNGLEKSTHELINMLVQYEATIHKSEQAVLVGEALSYKAKGKGARRWKRKKGKGTAITAIASTRGAPPAAPKSKGKGKVGGSSSQRQMMPASNPGMFVVEVLQRSRRLSKDERILRLGDEKVVAAEAVGSLRLVVSNLTRIDLKDVYFVPSMIWHARLDHISKDRIRRLVDSKSLEIDNLDHLPTCKSCLKGKMTKKPFVRQSTIVDGLLDLVHTDVCGPLSIPARGGFSYFITFTDDHSRYGYVHLMRYKSEALGRFKEYRLDVENQTNRKIKALRSDRGGYALEMAAKLLNIAPSKSVSQTLYEVWHGKPASYKYLRVWGGPAYVKRLVGDKLDSRSSLCRFIGYPKETAGYYFYDPAEQKVFVSTNTVFLEKGFPSDSGHDEVLIEESSEKPQHDSTISFEPTVHTDSVTVLRRSTRESRIPDRYGFVGLTSQLDNDPKTYGEAMSDIDSDKWLEATKFEMDLIGLNQVWILVDPLEGARPVGCKWVYKRKLGADGEVMAFKAKLVAKGYTQ